MLICICRRNPFSGSSIERLSHVDVQWAAWRRLADVPELDPGVGSSPCSRFTQSRDAALNYTVDYCYAGMINDLGQEREVYRVLTANP